MWGDQRFGCQDAGQEHPKAALGGQRPSTPEDAAVADPDGDRVEEKRKGMKETSEAFH